MHINTLSSIWKRSFLLMALASILVFPALPASAASFSKPMMSMIAKGKDIFLHDTFHGGGMTCDTCHTQGGMGPTKVPGSNMKGPSLSNAAAVFPRYKSDHGKVMTLADQIHGCIKGALRAKAPTYNSQTMRALETYIASLSQGKRLDMGGAYK